VQLSSAQRPGWSGGHCTYSETGVCHCHARLGKSSVAMVEPWCRLRSLPSYCSFEARSAVARAPETIYYRRFRLVRTANTRILGRSVSLLQVGESSRHPPTFILKSNISLGSVLIVHALHAKVQWRSGGRRVLQAWHAVSLGVGHNGSEVRDDFRKPVISAFARLT
jgi:hypothetical protein